MIWKDKARKTGWGIRAEFSIELHAKDLALLKRIQSFFGGVGNINNKSHGSVVYTIIKINDIRDVLIPHFNNYPLITQKQGDFVLFKTIVELMMVKSHLSCAGLQQIVGLKASMNKGLSDELKAAFPNIIPVPRPIVQCPIMLDPRTGVLHEGKRNSGSKLASWIYRCRGMFLCDN